MKVESLIRADKEDWSKLYHGYANFYKMPMNSDILDEVWDWIFNPDIKFYAIVPPRLLGRRCAVHTMIAMVLTMLA